MRTFQVYSHPTWRRFEAVKLGFSWPALFFGIFWMLVKELFSYAGIWFVLYLLLVLMEAVMDEARSAPGLQAIMYLILVVGYFALWLVPGFKGNAWRSQNLKKQGYDLVGTSDAETPKAAIGKLAKAT